MPLIMRVMDGKTGKMRKTIACTHYPKSCNFTDDSTNVVREHEKEHKS